MEGMLNMKALLIAYFFSPKGYVYIFQFKVLVLEIGFEALKIGVWNIIKGFFIKFFFQSGQFI